MDNIEPLIEAYNQTLQAGVFGIVVMMAGIIIMLVYLGIRVTKNTGDDQKSSNAVLETMTAAFADSLSPIRDMSTATIAQTRILERMETAMLDLPDKLAIVINPQLHDLTNKIDELSKQIAEVHTLMLDRNNDLELSQKMVALMAGFQEIAKAIEALKPPDNTEPDNAPLPSSKTGAKVLQVDAAADQVTVDLPVELKKTG